MRGRNISGLDAFVLSIVVNPLYCYFILQIQYL